MLSGTTPNPVIQFQESSNGSCPFKMLWHTAGLPIKKRDELEKREHANKLQQTEKRSWIKTLKVCVCVNGILKTHMGTID